MAGGAVLVLRGVVTDAADRPVAGARVALAAGPVALPDIAALTGDDGSFSFGLPQPGRYEVVAYGDTGHVVRTVDVSVGQATSVRLALPGG